MRDRCRNAGGPCITAIDINGYFAAPGTGGLSLYPTIPCRVFDTRKVGNGQPFTGTLAPPVDVVDGPCGVPATYAAGLTQLILDISSYFAP
jgi:hypothetical protein